MIGTRHRLESIYWGPWYNHEDPGWIISLQYDDEIRKRERRKNLKRRKTTHRGKLHVFCKTRFIRQ